MQRVMLKLSAESALRGGKVKVSTDEIEGGSSSKSRQTTVNQTKLVGSSDAPQLTRQNLSSNYEKVLLSVERASIALEEALTALPPETSASDSLAFTVSRVNSG